MLNKNAKGLTRSDRPRMWSQNCSQVNNWHTVDIVQSLILVETSTKEFDKISAEDFVHSSFSTAVAVQSVTGLCPLDFVLFLTLFFGTKNSTVLEHQL